MEFARHASWFAIGSVAAMICLPLCAARGPGAICSCALAVATVGFVSPFTQGGICITLLLTRLPYGGGWLYAADLLGAALGCLGVIFVLLVVDPVSATLWIGALAAGVGWVVVRGAGEAARASERRGCAYARRRGCGPYRPRPFRQEPSRVSLGQGDAAKRHAVRTLEHLFARAGHGLRRRPFRSDGASPTPRAQRSTRTISISTRTLAPSSRGYDGDLSKLAYLKDDVINAAYLVQSPADVAVVGVGGGRDVLSALLFRRQAHPRNRDQSRDLRSADRQVRRFLGPSRPPARRVAGQCRSTQLHQPFLRPIRPGSDLADRYLGCDGRRRIDAD